MQGLLQLLYLICLNAFFYVSTKYANRKGGYIIIMPETFSKSTTPGMGLRKCM